MRTGLKPRASRKAGRTPHTLSRSPLPAPTERRGAALSKPWHASLWHGSLWHGSLWYALRVARHTAVAVIASIPLLAAILPLTAHAAASPYGRTTVPVAADPDPSGSSGTSAEAIQRGRQVGVQLSNSTIQLSGDGVRGGKNDGYRIKRPCWYEPGPKPAEMLKQQQDLRSIFFHFNPNTTEEQFQRFLKQFRDRLDDDGRWWKPAYNAADPGGQACWSALEAFVFVPTGTTPTGGITVRELAEIARAALTVPEPRLKLNPETKSYVNLPTWIWLPGNAPATRSVTATIPGVMSATVTARRTRVEIDPGTTADRAEVKSQCGATGRPYTKGATFTCGVRYLRASLDRPRGAYELTVTTLWQVTSTATQPAGPLTFTPVRASTTTEVPVGEVQSTVRDSTS